MLICGEGEAGKLGLGSTQSVFLPCLVPLEAWPILVAAGGNHTVAVAGNHQYICEITTSTTNDRLQQSVEARIELLLTNLEAVTRLKNKTNKVQRNSANTNFCQQFT